MYYTLLILGKLFFYRSLFLKNHQSIFVTEGFLRTKPLGHVLELLRTSGFIGVLLSSCQKYKGDFHKHFLECSFRQHERPIVVVTRESL